LLTHKGAIITENGNLAAGIFGKANHCPV
jgi:hypothetical protein